MGTTLGNLHLYTRNVQWADELKNFGHTVLCLSDGWISILDRAFRPDVLEKEAKRISKAMGAPLLSFSLFDDDYVTLGLWKDGRRIFDYTDYPSPSMKGVSELERSLALDKEDTKKLRLLLHCEDARRKAELLEEFLGVALVIDTDFLSDGVDAFPREKGHALFDVYQAEQKQFGKINNRTKAVLTQEIHAKAADWWDALTLSYPDDNNIHPSNSTQPCILKDGMIKPLLGEEVRVRTLTKILTSGNLATVLEPVHAYGVGRTSWPVARQYALGGSMLRQFPIPEHVQQFACMLSDGSIIAQWVEDTERLGWGRCWLICIAADGCARWQKTLDGGQFCGDAVEYEGSVYAATRDLPAGITLYKVDTLGEILCQRSFPQAIELYFRHLKCGGLLCAIREAGPHMENRWFIMTLNEEFSTRSAFELPQTIWPVFHSRFDRCVLDAQEKSLFFVALESEVVRVDLDGQKCFSEHLPGLGSVDCMDQNGLLYGRLSNSVFVLDGGLRLVSRHRLKGDVLFFQCDAMGVYAVTATGNAAHWGEPETCFVRVYRFE